MFICLFVSSVTEKNYWPVFMKLGGRITNGPWKILLCFGADLNYEADKTNYFSPPLTV